MSNHPETGDPGSETVVIVDRDNRETGVTSRRVMREQRLIHRASYILVTDPDNRLLVQRRTMSKDVYPGYWDVAAGGVVLAGESYEESARRELREELGIRAPLRFLFDQYFEDQNNRVWGRIFLCQHTGPFLLQEEEVAEAVFMSVDEIRQRSRHEPFTPDGLLLLDRLEFS